MLVWRLLTKLYGVRAGRLSYLSISSLSNYFLIKHIPYSREREKRMTEINEEEEEGEEEEEW